MVGVHRIFQVFEIRGEHEELVQRLRDLPALAGGKLHRLLAVHHFCAVRLFKHGAERNVACYLRQAIGDTIIQAETVW